MGIAKLLSAPKTTITVEHVLVLQEIVEFLQERGWEVENLDIRRYDDAQDPMEPTENWKAKEIKWYVNISTAPQNQEVVFAKHKSQPTTI